MWRCPAPRGRARLVSHYDFNNTYQYVIDREETHLSWLQNALADVPRGRAARRCGARFPAAIGAESEPESRGGGAFPQTFLDDDARYLGGERFVDGWRPRIAHVTHARHRNMLNVILGESMEHKRFFEQAAAGFEDLLGRRADGAGHRRRSPAHPVDRAVTTQPRPPGRASRIGSNLGDRRAAMAFAVDRLSGVLSDLIISIDHRNRARRTQPARVLPNDRCTSMPLSQGRQRSARRALLGELLAIERDFGRERPYPGAARTLDLDLILLDEDVIDEPDLRNPPSALPQPVLRARTIGRAGA